MNPSWISDVEADDDDEDEEGVAHRLLQRRLQDAPNPYPILPPIPPPIPIADLDNRQRLHPDKVAAIMAMGFSREEAIVALNWETGNLQRALLYLLGE